jgi:hypothetical protein
MGRTKDPEPVKLPVVSREYGIRTNDHGVLNFGVKKLAAEEAGKAAGLEVVFRALSEWQPISQEEEG